MDKSIQLVVFNLEEQRFALHLNVVERVIPAVEITQIPRAPDIVPGVINVQGTVMPVVNIRKRFRFPEREMELSDQLIIVNTATRKVALIVDSASGVDERSKREVVSAEKIVPGMEYVEGVLKMKDGLVLIFYIDLFLSIEQEKLLEDEIRKTDRKAKKKAK